MDYRHYDDARWHEMWHRQAVSGDVAEIPPLAPEDVQRFLHGVSGTAAIAGALQFRRLIRSQVGAPTPDQRFLDFGCGWGRHLRVFMKDYALENMHGVDIFADNIELCRKYLPGINFIQSYEGEALPIAARSMDLIMAFSVFSHLSEASARYWLNELARIAKPGGTIVVTSWGQALIDIAARVKATGKTDYPWEQNIAKGFGDFEQVIPKYQTGEFVFGRHGSSGPLDPDLYGISMMPRAWVERNAPVRITHFVDEPKVVPQATFFLTPV